MTNQLILFDLDGTLVDSVPDLAYAVDQTMRHLGRPACGEERVRDWVGNGVERLVKRALVGALEGEPEQALFEQAFEVFSRVYANHNGQRSRLYPGVREALDRLRASRHYHLACVTNKAERFTTPLLSSLGIDQHFSLVVCGDTLAKKKPDPLPLLHAAEHYDLPPGQCLMIGDSINDVRAARAAGFQVFCVPYGYNHGQDIRLAQPDLVIASLLEIEAALAGQKVVNQ